VPVRVTYRFVAGLGLSFMVHVTPAGAAPAGPAPAADVGALVAGLGAGDRRTRQEAMVALHRQGLAAVPALIETARDPAKRPYVARALAQLNCPDATALGFSYYDELSEADRAGGQLRGLDSAVRTAAKELLIEMVKGDDRQAQLDAAEVLGAVAGDAPETIAAFISQLRLTDRARRNVAVSGLRQAGAAAVPALCEALKDKGSTAGALRALSEINYPSTDLSRFDKLTEKKRPEKPGLRAVDARAAAALKASIPRLIEVLEKDRSEVHANFASEVLGEIGSQSPEAIEALVKRAADGREDAGAALAAIGPASKAALTDATSAARPGSPARRVLEKALARVDATAVPGVAGALTSPRHQERVAAAQALIEGGPDSVPLLMTAMRTPTDRREAPERSDIAQIALRNFKRNRQPAAAALLAALKDRDNAHLRLYAAHLAGEMKLKEAVPALAAGLEEAGEGPESSLPLNWNGGAIPPESWRGAAGGALRKMWRGSAEDLRDALRHPSHAVRTQAIIELAHIGDQPRETADVLVSLVLDGRASSKYVQEWLVRALINCGEGGTAALTTALSDKVPQRRAAVVEFLGQMGPMALPALAKATRDPQPEVRAAAARAYLALRGEPQFSPGPLLDLVLDDKSADVRAAAANVLRYGGGLPVTTACRQAIKDADPRVRAAAAAGLAREYMSSVQSLTGAPTEPPAAELLDALLDKDAAVREAAAVVLRQAPVGPLAAPLVKALQSPQARQHTGARLTLLSLLARPEAAAAAAPAAALLADKDPAVRAAAARVAGATGMPDRAMLQALAALALRDEEAAVRHAATLGLANFGSPPQDFYQSGVGRFAPRSGGDVAVRKAIEALKADLKGANAATRVQAALALGCLGMAAEEALPVLLEATDVAAADAAHARGALALAAAIDRAGGSSPRAAEMYLAAIRDKSGRIRPCVALPLAAAGPAIRGEITNATPRQRAVAPLSQALEGGDARSRLVAALALYRLLEESQVPAASLLPALADPDPVVRLAAADALQPRGRLAPVEGSMQALLGALGDREIAVARAAAQSLSSMNAFGDGGRPDPTDSQAEQMNALQIRFHHPDAPVRAAAMTAMADFGRLASQAVPEWIVALDDTDPAVRAAAVAGLRKFHDVVFTQDPRFARQPAGKKARPAPGAAAAPGGMAGEP
jgi:HEAT repeat protein